MGKRKSEAVMSQSGSFASPSPRRHLNGGMKPTAVFNHLPCLTLLLNLGGSCTSFWTCKYEIRSSKRNAWSVEGLDFNISNSAFGGYRKGISSAPAYFLMNDNSWFASMLSPCILWAWQYSSPSSMFFSRLQGFAPISLAQWIPDEGTMTVFLSHAKNTASNIGKFLHNSFTCFLYRKRASIDFYKNTV